MKIFKGLLTTFAFLALSSLPAMAESHIYSDAEFTKVLESGAAVVLDFHAGWCPTCRAQEKAFDTLLKDQKLSSVTVFKVDFDNSDSLKKKYQVSKQSTLVLFKDKKEIDRNMGVSGLEELRAFLSKGI